MIMRVAVIGPKISPPWDSAAATVGRGILLTLGHLCSQGYIDEIFVLTTRVPLRRILRNYGFVPRSIHDFDGLPRRYAKWYVIRHYGNAFYIEKRLAELSLVLSKRSRFDVALYVGFPKNPLMLRFLVKFVSRALLLYAYAIPSLTYISLLRRVLRLSHLGATRVLVVTPSIHAYELLSTHIGASHAELVPPIVETSVFKPLDSNAKRITQHGPLRIGYAGPVHYPRFRIETLAKALVILMKHGIDLFVDLRSLLRHGRRDWIYIHRITELFKKVLGDQRFKVSAGQMSRAELNEFYNSIDVLLYLFEVSREAEVADPPLVPLEALSAGTPVIISSGSSLDAYLRPLVKMGAVKIVSNNALEVAEAVCGIMNKNTKILASSIHEHIDERFSPRVISSRIRNLLEELS